MSTAGYILNESEGGVINRPKIIEDTGDIVIFDTALQTCDDWNRNGRQYSRKALEEAINSDQFQELLVTKSAWGEGGHPLEDTIERQLWIDQKNITHIVTKVWWEGNTLMGRIETAATDAGRDMYGLITKNKILVAFSMRGIAGVVKQTKRGPVIDGKLKIAAYDWVRYPSHKSAYAKAELGETHYTMPPSFTSQELSRVAANESAALLTESTESGIIVNQYGHIVAESFLNETIRNNIDDIVLSL